MPLTDYEEEFVDKTSEPAPVEKEEPAKAEKPPEPVEKEEPVEEEEKEEPTRYQKRIDALTYRSKLAEERLEEEREERARLAEKLEALEEKLQKTSTSSAESDLESKLKAAREKRKDALTRGDGDELDEADEEIYALRRQLEQVKTPPKKEEPTETRTRSTSIPPAEQAWLERNQWFVQGENPDDVKRVAAIYQGLVGEGEDRLEENFYEELDRRIARALPHRKAKEEGNKSNRPTRSPVKDSSRAPGRKPRTTEFTDRHLQIMKKYGFGDPNNMEDRKEFLRLSQGEEL